MEFLVHQSYSYNYIFLTEDATLFDKVFARKKRQ